MRRSDVHRALATAVFLAGALALATVVHGQRPPADAVVLRSGEVLRGTVIELRPGVHVIIRLENDEVRIVGAEDLLRVRFGDTAALVAPPSPVAPDAGAPPSALVPDAAVPPVPTADGGVPPAPPPDAAVAPAGDATVPPAPILDERPRVVPAPPPAPWVGPVVYDDRGGGALPWHDDAMERAQPEGLVHGGFRIGAGLWTGPGGGTGVAEVAATLDVIPSPLSKIRGRFELGTGVTGAMSSYTSSGTGAAGGPYFVARAFVGFDAGRKGFVRLGAEGQLELVTVHYTSYYGPYTTSSYLQAAGAGAGVFEAGTREHDGHLELGISVAIGVAPAVVPDVSDPISPSFRLTAFFGWMF